MTSFLSRYSFLCYALITLGQLWLYSLNLRSEGLYERVTIHSAEWIGSHNILFIGALLIIPATLVLKDHLKEANKWLVIAAVVLSLLGAVSLIGQFTIDFYLVALFKGLSSEAAYMELELIRNNKLIQLLFYDLVALWVLGQIAFIIVLLKESKLPKWALALYFIAILMLVLGNSIHELIERTSYLLVTIALFPIFIARKSKRTIKIEKS